MARVLILGVNGQDGSYLAESLLKRGHTVFGVGRDSVSRHVPSAPGFHYRHCDLPDEARLTEVIAEAEPDQAFHFAALHGAIADAFSYETQWSGMMRVNVLALHTLLEHARLRAPQMHVVYGGSCKVFPAPLRGDIDERTTMKATCLYGIGKLAARDLLAHYRRAHGVATTNLILFNHDSARRPAVFFLPIVARGLAAARLDRDHRFSVQTLDFMIDWSAADELMELVADLGDRRELDEVIMASGTTLYAREIVKRLFAEHGLDVLAHVHERKPQSDPGPHFQVRIDRLEAAVGRRPTKTIFQIVDDILQSLAHAR